MKKQFKLFLLLMFLLAVSACKQSSPSSNLSLNDIESLSICAPMNYGSNMGFSAKIKTLGSSSSLGYYDYVQIRLGSLPTAFAEGRTYIQFYRYMFTPNVRDAYTDNKALKLEIVDANNPTRPLLSNVTSFSLADLSSYNISNLIIVVEVGGSSYHALEMVQFNSNDQEMGSNIGLLPPFTAKPETYMAEKARYGSAVDTMMQLHPYTNQRGMGNELYYANKAYSDFCFNGLFTN